MVGKSLLVLASALALSGCNGTNVDGTYASATKVGLFNTPMVIHMTINNDRVKMSTINDGINKAKDLFELDARVEGDTFYIYDKNQPKSAKDTEIVFHIKNGGKTLQCDMCQAVGIPVVWEKQS